MNDVIWRRGPDGEGFFHAGPVGLAMRRLSIIDLEGGWQPIFNEDRTVAVVFNGEIYNYRELRAQLEQRGHKFSTHSDTEVLVHLYEDHGADLATHLQGMFVFALWDVKRQKLLLGRDRLGIKPLFIARVEQGILFGSEIKSLLASGLVPTDMDWQALDQLVTYNFIPSPRTIYAAISKIEPGTVVTIGLDGAVNGKRYWSIPDAPTQNRSEQEWEEIIEARLKDAVRSHLVSDVPVGAFLSGGVDSGLLVAMMAQFTDRPVETFTVGFTEAGSAFLDERVYARKIAERYRLNHHELNVEPHVADILGQIVDAFDEPFADDSVVPSYYVSKVAAERVKVALTGLGGDELFGGYRRYLGLKLGDAYSRLPAALRTTIIDPIVRRLPEPTSSHEIIDHLKRFSRASSQSAERRYQDSMSALPAAERARLYSRDTLRELQMSETEKVITGPFVSFAHGTSVERALKTDLKVYLPDDILTLTDRLSMWHSLELRVPYLDHRFVEEVMTLPVSYKLRGLKLKHLLKRIALKWLPQDVVTHKKQGFEAPMGRWLRGPLREMLEDTLSQAAIRRHGVFDYAEVQRLKQEHLNGERKHNKVLFSLLMFQLWSDRRGALAASALPQKLAG
jgi:asparagine synthase (glutamine-hydrolysing)